MSFNITLQAALLLWKPISEVREIVIGKTAKQVSKILAQKVQSLPIVKK